MNQFILPAVLFISFRDKYVTSRPLKDTRHKKNNAQDISIIQT